MLMVNLVADLLINVIRLMIPPVFLKNQKKWHAIEDNFFPHLNSHNPKITGYIECILKKTGNIRDNLCQGKVEQVGIFELWTSKTCISNYIKQHNNIILITYLQTFTHH